MIKVKITENGNILYLRLEGHAGYAEHGTDIVCASASILAYTVAKIVDDALARGWLNKAPIIDMDGGSALIVCEPIEEKHHDIRQAYMVARVGYELLSQNHPKYVRLLP